MNHWVSQINLRLLSYSRSGKKCGALVKFVLFSLTISFLQACYYLPVMSGQMVVWDVEPYDSSTPYNFVVIDTEAQWGSNDPFGGILIGSEHFGQALSRSLELVNLQDEDASPSNTYLVEAVLIDMDKPVLYVGGGAITSEVYYRVSNKETGEYLLTETITHEGTATIKERLPNERVTLATERSIQGNFKKFIELVISKLKE